MKKRWTAVVLALALALALLPGTALAAEGDGSAGSRLTGVDRAVYQVLKDEAAKIADGTRTGTAIRIPDQAGLSWTLSELGAAGESQSVAMEKLKKKVADALHIERVYTALVSDCAYELFWRGTEYTYNCSYSLQGNRGSVRNLTVTFQVAQAYQGGGSTTVSADKVAAAKRAAENARAIVDKYRDKSDYEKLSALAVPMPELLDVDRAQERLLKELLPGETIYRLALRDGVEPWQLEQAGALSRALRAAGLNIDWFPTNFMCRDGILYYVDYECNPYMEEWSFERWGIRYWSRTPELDAYAAQHRDSNRLGEDLTG